MKTIELEKIVGENNRKYTKDEGFEQLVNSIKEYGIIEPPVVRELEDGTYKIIAGRRRIAAVRKLTKGSKGAVQVNCVIVERDDSRSDDDIALAENVNRQGMHPLDEAALFFKMECRGLPVKEIAKLYARSPQDIYKRLRLMRLTDDLKIAFRDNLMHIEAAAIIAELPEEDQKEFHEKYRDEWKNTRRHPEIYDGDEDRVTGHEAAEFVHKKQKYKIRKLIKGCADCKKRTHNTGNDLFEELDGWDDVCLDGECYRKKWYDAINKALNDQIKSDVPPADYKIYFAGGIPAELYKKASHIEFNGQKCEVIKPNKYEFTHEETNRKKDACWRIREHGDGQITVERVGYKVKEKAKDAPERGAAKPAAKSKEGYGKEGYEVDDYCRGALEEIAKGRNTTAAELVKDLRKSLTPYVFSSEVEDRLRKYIIVRRVESDAVSDTNIKDYFSLFLRALDGECTGEWEEKRIDKEMKKLLKEITGYDSFSEANLHLLSSEAQKVFHFMLLNILEDMYNENIPNLDELKKLKKGDSLWFDYAGMEKEEYGKVYMLFTEQVINEALNKKPKAELKKKEKTSGGESREERW